MIGFDERLREDFAGLTAGAPPDLGIDPDALVSAGRRRQNVRTARGVLAGAAVAVVAVTGSWGLLAGQGSLTAPALPAAPVGSQAWVDNPAYFDLTDVKLDSSTRFRKVALAVTPAAAGWDVAVDLTSSDGTLMGSSSFRAGSGLTVQPLSPQVVLALLPTATSWWDVAMDDPSAKPSNLESMRPGKLDVTAILLTFDSAAQANGIAGFIWQQPDGSLVDNLGTTVATAQVRVGNRSATLYWDDALQRLGYRLDGGLSIGVHTGAPSQWPAFPRLQYSERSPTDDSATWVLADLLPAGAADLRIDLVPKASAWTTTDLGGRTAYLIVSQDDSSAQPIRSLRYRDADGKQATFSR